MGLAELLDRSQLVAIAYGARFSFLVALLGMFTATLLANLVSASLGTAISLALPLTWIEIGSGLLFVVLGGWVLARRRTSAAAEPTRTPIRRGSFLAVAGTYLVAQLGDLSSLTTLSLASRQQALIAVWLGSVLGVTAANGLGIALGAYAGERIPERVARWGVALIFVAIGVGSVAEGAGHPVGPRSTTHDRHTVRALSSINAKLSLIFAHFRYLLMATPPRSSCLPPCEELVAGLQASRRSPGRGRRARPAGSGAGSAVRVL